MSLTDVPVTDPAPATPPPAAAAAASSGGGLPQLGEKWYEALPEDMRDDPSLKLIPDIPTMAKTLIHAQKAIGADKVPLPSKHATEEDWKRFYNKIGLPEKFDDYKIEAPKDAVINEEFFKGAREQMFKQGVLPKQAQEMMNWYLAEEKKYSEINANNLKNTTSNWEKGLKDEWGQAYDQKLGIAKQAVKFINDPELDKFLNESLAGRNPSVIKAFEKLGQLLVEDKVIQPAGNSMKLSPKEAENQANLIMGNLEHPYHNPAHPGHANAVAEVQELFSAAYPDKSGT